MDPIEQARHKSYKRLLARGLSHEEAMVKAGLADAPVPVSFAVESVVQHEVKPEKKEVYEGARGKVMVEITVHLDNPITFLYRTDMRGALLKTQQNRKFLGMKFSEFLRSFLGRVDDIS